MQPSLEKLLIVLEVRIISIKLIQKISSLQIDSNFSENELDSISTSASDNEIKILISYSSMQSMRPLKEISRTHQRHFSNNPWAWVRNPCHQ